MNPSILMKSAVLAICAALLACSSSPQATATAAPAPAAHGKISKLSQVEGDVALCDHKVPEQVCVKHHPELVANFKKVGDWCPEHDVPESQCHLCHADLDFSALPTLPADADFALLSKAGEDVPDLAAHVVPGKVTVFDFYADWCAPCRKIDRHLHGVLQERKDVAVRKLNMVTWETPLAKRYLANATSMPVVTVYGRRGKLVATIVGFDLAALDKAIATGAAQ